MKLYLPKHVVIPALVILSLPVVGWLAYVTGQADAKHEYEAMTQKCGHVPIVMSPTGLGNEGMYSITLGSTFPQSDDQYFCTVSEARANSGGSYLHVMDEKVWLYP